jgi:hypothetical protein
MVVLLAIAATTTDRRPEGWLCHLLSQKARHGPERSGRRHAQPLDP